MVRSKSQTNQEIIKNKHERTIISALANRRMKFVELLKVTGLSKPSLSERLKELELKKWIVHGGRREPYELTDLGIKQAEGQPIIAWTIDSIINAKNRFSYNSLISQFNLGYKGIGVDVLSTRDFPHAIKEDISNLLYNKYKEVENLVLERVPDVADNEKDLRGKLVFSFTVDLEDMKEQFLRRYDRSSIEKIIRQNSNETIWKNEDKWSKLFKLGEKQ